MQVYAVTLLCLTSLISIISFDAWCLRKRCEYVRVVERKEDFLTAQYSAYAESIYPDKVRSLASKVAITQSSQPSHEKKTVKISKKKKQQYRLLHVPFSRPPNHSRLNLYAFLSEQPDVREHSMSWYAIFSRLIKRVYVDTGHFPNEAPALVVNALLSKKEEILLAAQTLGEDSLSTIVFPGEVSDMIYRMLQGSDLYPSLLNFLQYEKKNAAQCKLNLFFMHSLLLEAVLNHPQAYRQIDALRKDILERVRYQEQEIQTYKQAAVLELFKTRTDFRKELQDQAQILLSQYDLLDVLNKKCFDYTLGSTGDYLFITNPYTHIDVRVKCSLKTSIDSSASHN